MQSCAGTGPIYGDILGPHVLTPPCTQRNSYWTPGLGMNGKGHRYKHKGSESKGRVDMVQKSEALL